MIVLLICTVGLAQKIEPTAAPSPTAELEPIVRPSPPLAGYAQPVQPIGPRQLLGIRNWTTDTWTAIAAIVAFAALVQPWLLALWRRLFRSGALDIYEAAKIEFGFSTYGPTIGLIGSFRSLHKDMFVHWVRVQLIKERDGSVHEFEWKAFRTPKMSFGTTAGQLTEVSLEVPFSFMVSPLQPHRFNILFSDEAAVQPAHQIVEKLQQEWLSRIQKFDLPNLGPNSSMQPDMIKKLRRAFSDLSASQTYTEAADVLNKLNYWEAGKYQLTLSLQTARPNRSITKTWTFTIVETELSKLETNVTSILEEVCRMPLSASEYGFGSALYNS